MFTILSFREKDEWLNTICRIENIDVYYFPEYSSLYHMIGDGEPYLAVYEDYKKNITCYPFIKRDIKLPFDNRPDEKIFDIITPYGFGGPYCRHPNENIMNEFRKCFDDYCLNNNIISEFIRFHPLLANHQYLDKKIDVIYDRETIYIDLKKSEDEILDKYHKNHKRNLYKAAKHQLEFKVFEKEDALNNMDTFYELYRQTMDKLGASPYYYFSRDYVKDLLTGMYENSVIASVFLEDQMISGALCMFNDKYMHYHLGCSNKQFLHLGTNIFQFHHMALWGKSKHLQLLHLGGGHIGRDSLFQFKHRFNPEGILGFYVGRKIHDIKRYDELVKCWEQYYLQSPADHFFPAYRFIPKFP